MKALVVGGAGYIGSHFTRYLCDRGWDVTVMDNLSTGREDNVDDRAAFLPGDILHLGRIMDVLYVAQPDVVFGFAGLKAAGESMKNPSAYATNNIAGMINLLDGMIKHNVRNFVFSSSAAVYGTPVQLPIDEMHPVMPLNFYGFTKLEIERVLNWYSQLGQIRYAALRYFNAAGFSVEPSEYFTPHRENTPTNLLPVVMETALGERFKVEVFGDDYDTHDGTGVRDYIHIDDLASAHLLAAEHLLNADEDLVVNLGTERNYSVMDVIRKASEVTGKVIVHDVVDRRPGDPAEVLASSKLSRDLLGWEPQYSDLDTLLRTMWNVYKRDLI